MIGDVWPIVLSAAIVLALAQCCALVTLYASLGRLLFRKDSRYMPLMVDDGPPLNRPMPRITGEDARTGQPLAQAQFTDRKRVVLFVNPGCDTCEELLQAVREQPSDGRDKIAILLVVQAEPSEAAAYTSKLPESAVLVDPEERIFRSCGVQITPLGVLVDRLGYVRMKGIVNNRDQLAGLIASQGRSMEGISVEPETPAELSTTEVGSWHTPVRDGAGKFG